MPVVESQGTFVQALSLWHGHMRNTALKAILGIFLPNPAKSPRRAGAMPGSVSLLVVLHVVIVLTKDNVYNHMTPEPKYYHMTLQLRFCKVPEPHFSRANHFDCHWHFHYYYIRLTPAPLQSSTKPRVIFRQHHSSSDTYPEAFSLSKSRYRISSS